MVRQGNALHVPPFRTDTSGTGTIQADLQRVRDSNSPVQDLSIMVPRTVESNTVSSDTVVESRRRHSNTRRHSTGRISAQAELPFLGPTRVAALIRIFISKGHSKRVSEFMVKNLRPSSINVYESHWKTFVNYCRRKNLNVFNIRSLHFSRYLMILFNQGLRPNTIMTHRTSIASVLRH